MGLNLKSIFDTAADLLPGGTLVKSIVKGAGALVLKKAAKQVGVAEKDIESVLSSAEKIAAEDEEIKQALREEEKKRREFELSFYGRAADLSPKAQLWRAITRPILSIGLVGLFAIGILIQYGQQLFGADKPLTIPPETVELGKWIVAFWFSSRGVEKVVQLFDKS